MALTVPTLPQINAVFNNKLTDGWWMFIGIVGSIALAGTVVAPGVLGIMTIVLIYQSVNLVQGT